MNGNPTMRPTIKRLLLAALLAGTATSAAAQSAYYGLTIVDPVAETRTPDSYIVVDRGRIVEVGTGRPPIAIAPADRHDFTGRFALPGLFDMHAHVSIGPLTGRAVDGVPVFDSRGNDSITRHSALMLLAHGVTTIRDPAGETERAIAYRDAVAAGDLLGPEARVAGEAIHRSPFAIEGLIARVTGPDDVTAIVRRQAEAGVDFVKLYEGLTAEELAAGIAEAERAGVGTIAHLSDVSWTRAAELGVEALVHAIPISPDLLPEARREAYRAARRPASYAFFEWYEHADLDSPEIRRMVQTLAERGVEFDATMIAFQLAFWGDEPQVRDRDVWAAHPAFVDNWRNRFRFDLGWEPSDYARAKAVWPKVLRLVRMLYEAGVPMTIGTDMNNPFVAPGASLAREMQLHADAGIPNWAVLRMATSEAARALDLEERTGRLREGMEADIVFLSADPTLDVGAVAAPVAVMANGRLYDPAALRAQAAAIAASAPAADCGDGCSPDSVITALYEAVSAGPGEGWDRERLRALFHPDARLVTAIPEAEATRSSGATINEFIASMERHFRATGVLEQEYRRDVRTFGDLASIYSSFYLRAGGADRPPLRGLNHFQLLRTDGRWRIVSNVALMEGGGWSLPPAFQP